MASSKSQPLQVGAVIAVGLVEGSLRHTNVKLLTTLLLWWFLGFGAVILGTTVLVAQGKLCHCMSFGLLQLVAGLQICLLSIGSLLLTM